MKENIVIIDGSSLLYRAFYAIPHLTDAQGQPMAMPSLSSPVTATPCSWSRTT